MIIISCKTFKTRMKYIVSILLILILITKHQVAKSLRMCKIYSWQIPAASKH